MKPRKTASGVRLLALILLLSLPASAPATQPVRIQDPVIDGDLSDLIDFVESIRIGGSGLGVDLFDSEKDVAVLDPEFHPCSPLREHYFVNGFDISRAVVALHGGDLLLGLRAAGIIGDTDGDGNPDGTCGATGIRDARGIAGDDRYVWALDTNCSLEFSPDVTVSMSANALHVVGIAFDEATYRFQGTDLEARLTNVRSSSAGTWGGLAARAFANSSADGLSEDSSPAQRCPPPSPSLELGVTLSPRELLTGGVLTLSVVVSNRGKARLDIVRVRDRLPPGYAYIPGSVRGIGEPVDAGGGELHFPDLALNPGEARRIRFHAGPGDGCSGEATNLVSVNARAIGSCYPPPGYLDLVDSEETRLTVRSGLSSGRAGPAPAALTPTGFLTRNYPNPVSGGNTVIYYTVPIREARTEVEIEIFDAGGRRVRRLVSAENHPGTHTVGWDLADEDGEPVASGIYFYRLSAGGEHLTRKMVVLRRPQ